MRFMIIRKADKATEAGELPSPELLTQLIEDMTQYNQELLEKGHLLGGDGLLPSSQGARLVREGGKERIVDGPFAETKELIAGFTLIQADSMAQAIELVKRWPLSDGDVTLEIRPIVGDDYFGDAFTPEQREREERQRAAIEQKQKG